MRNVLFSGLDSELASLRKAHRRQLMLSEDLRGLAEELKRVNEALWKVEDALRVCEMSEDFGPRFIELARAVYRQNDRRA